MTDFSWGSDWADWAQNKRIRGLEEDLSYMSASLSSAQSSTRRLKSELSKVRGSLEQRLDRLSSAFDAFVEISDVRMTLGLFDAQGRVRHQARQLLDKKPVDGEVSDVDGYWLAPALNAMLVAVDGVVDIEAMELARARDRRRATVFHVLGTMVLGGRDSVTDEMLADALPALSGEVVLYQRAVWTLLADGFFGSAGWELARRRGSDLLAAMSDEDRAGAVAELSTIATPAVTAVSVPRKLDGIGDVAESLKACEQLSAMVKWTSEALAGFTNEPELDVDPMVRQTLELLVNEGSPVELPLLNRERELRAVIESNGQAGKASAAWDVAGGEPLPMLRDDVQDAEHAGRRALAIRITAPHILAAGEKYAQIAQRPVPPQVQARTRHGVVTITATGAEPASVEAAKARIGSAEPASGQRRFVAYGAAGAGVLLVVVAIFAGWGWVVPALGLFGVAVGQWWMYGNEVRDLKEQRDYSLASFEEEIAKQVSEFVSLRDKLVARQGSVADDLSSLRSLLVD